MNIWRWMMRLKGFVPNGQASKFSSIQPQEQFRTSILQFCASDLNSQDGNATDKKRHLNPIFGLYRKRCVAIILMSRASVGRSQPAPHASSVLLSDTCQRQQSLIHWACVEARNGNVRLIIFVSSICDRLSCTSFPLWSRR